MNDCMIPMRSRTEAEKGRRLARLSRISASVVPVDPAKTKNGCSVGLRVPCQSAGRLALILDENSVNHGDIIGRIYG